MSVFQLKDWWSCQICQEEEEFDIGCMCIGNVDNSHPAVDKIVIGSQQGILRIYNPQHPQYRVEDLIFEAPLINGPILQILLGQFIPANETLALAVLHPRKLVVYELIPSNSNNGGGDGKKAAANFYTLDKLYEHDLGLGGKHFTAFNMTSGNFGGVMKREMIIVQSLDGKLQIFEQSANAFTRQLVDCMIPGPIAYLSRLDAFVTCTYASQAECYRYQVLASAQTEVGSASASAAGGLSTTGAFGLTAVRSAMVEWSLNLGEGCKQIVTGGVFSRAGDSNANASNAKGRGEGPVELLMLCDKSLFLLKDSGGLLQQRRLERDPACMCAFKAGAGGRTGYNFLIANQDCTIQVFSEFNLVWAAKVETVPVQVAVGNFGDQKGLIVTLDETGKLSLSYLGTRPPTTAVATNFRELDYDKVDEEHRALLQVIRESQSETKSEPREKLQLRCQMVPTFDKDPVSVDLPNTIVPMSTFASPGGGGMLTTNGMTKVSARLYVSFSGTGSGDRPATKVSLLISAPSFVHVVPKNIILDKVSGSQSTPIMVKVYFYATRQCLPSNLDAQVLATYTSPNGEPRIANYSFQLPLSLACKVKAASKSANFKFTLDTEAPAQQLTDLFDDYLFALQDVGMEVGDVLGSTAAQAMGFQFWTNNNNNNNNNIAENNDYNNNNGSNSNSSSYSNNVSNPALVSILVSKTAGRYRVQSDCLSALTLIVNELERRLNARLKELGHSGTSFVTCADALPLSDFYSAIDAHFTTRQALEEKLSQLNDVSHQFRLVEKKLLVRFKDRNPTPLGGLDSIMRESYNRILMLADDVEMLQRRLREQMCDLDSIARLVVSLAGVKFNLSSAERSILQSHLCPDLVDGSEQGWEETVDASFIFLLKTSLAKVSKDTTTLPANSLGFPADTTPLKKHISMVFDRLSKGGKLSSSNTNTNTNTNTGSGSINTSASKK